MIKTVNACYDDKGNIKCATSYDNWCENCLNYEELLKQTPKFNPSVISKFEKGDDFEIAEADCDSGICPIR